MDGWPVSLTHGPVTVRPLVRRDGRAWREARLRNRAWLERWEGAPASMPPSSWEARHSPEVFGAMLREHRRRVRQGVGMPFAVTYDGAFAGQVTVSNVTRGAFDSATLGYWVDERVAGRGVMPVSVALVVDHCFAIGLHRVEVNIRPENAASLRVAEKLGLRTEGLHEKFLYIDGGWRDHVTFALVREDVQGSLLQRLLSSRDTPRRLHQE